jgi:hypothetical protein
MTPVAATPGQCPGTVRAPIAQVSIHPLEPKEDTAHEP